MAKKEEAQLILKIKQVGGKALKSIPGMLKAISGATLAAGAAIAGFAAGMGKLVNKSEEFDAVADSFANLAARQGQDSQKMLQNMRKLSVGTVSDMKLMQEANNALLLGLPVERFDDMLKIARSAAKATGQSMEFMLQSITTGLGRGSKLMLDNLGIVFKLEDAHEEYAASLGKTASQLTEAEKKQAFINKALETGLANARGMGEQSENLSDKTAQLKAQFDNLLITLGKNLAPAFKVVLDNVIDMFNSFAAFTATDTFQEYFIALTKTALGAKEVIFGLFNLIGDFGAGVALLIQGIVNTNLDQIRTGVQAASELFAEDFNAIFDNIKTNNQAIDEEFKKREQIQKKRKAEAAKQRKIAIAKAQKETAEAEAKKTAIVQLEGEARVNAQRDSFSKIATLAHSNNKSLAMIGKAAALTQIAIEAPKGVAKALAAFPPPANFVAAGAVGAAFAVQAAKVAGIQLADGGIVQARQGGTPAILGEGGRDEAVIPLDGAGGGLGTTINIQAGALMGDEGQAREFAEMIDRELLKLRQDNSSLAFDTDVV